MKKGLCVGICDKPSHSVDDDLAVRSIIGLPVRLWISWLRHHRCSIRLAHWLSERLCYPVTPLLLVGNDDCCLIVTGERACLYGDLISFPAAEVDEQPNSNEEHDNSDCNTGGSATCERDESCRCCCTRTAVVAVTVRVVVRALSVDIAAVFGTVLAVGVTIRTHLIDFIGGILTAL